MRSAAAAIFVLTSFGTRSPGLAAPDFVSRSQVQQGWLSDRTNVVPGRSFAASDTSVRCFEGFLTEIVSPACFVVDVVPNPDCVSHSRMFMVQYFYPEFTTQYRVRGFAFISNDGATVFPSAGVVFIPSSEGRFPTPTELSQLPARNVPTPHDTADVVVDLRAYNLVFGPNTDIAVCLQFPEGGKFTSLGNGPGILADHDPPNQSCDNWTLNNGQAGSWYEPRATDPQPLDWGFALIYEPVLEVSPASWTRVKSLYKVP